MTRLDDTLVAIAYVRQSDQIPGLLARVAAAYGMKTVVYLGIGTLDRKVPHGRFHLESAPGTSSVPRAIRMRPQ